MLLGQQRMGSKKAQSTAARHIRDETARPKTRRSEERTAAQTAGAAAARALDESNREGTNSANRDGGVSV